VRFVAFLSWIASSIAWWARYSSAVFTGLPALRRCLIFFSWFLVKPLGREAFEAGMFLRLLSLGVSILQLGVQMEV
jgi:hypothetical protein